MAHSHSPSIPPSGTARSPLPADAVRMAKAASAGTHTDFRTLLASSLQESHHDPAARNKRSSAAGAYQFTERTWLDLMRRHGAELGHAELASQIAVKDGAPHVADPDVRVQILALRADTPLAGAMAARYFEENRASLAHSLGRRPSDNEVRMAYLLGASGATRLIKTAVSHPNLAADRVVPSAVRHNPGLFRRHDGTVVTASQAVAALDRHFDAAMRQVRHAVGRQFSMLLPSEMPADDETG